MNEYRELWALIESDLARARQMLPDSTTCDEAVGMSSLGTTNSNWPATNLSTMLKITQFLKSFGLHSAMQQSGWSYSIGRNDTTKKVQPETLPIFSGFGLN
jgi:hypothetical protein